MASKTKYLCAVGAVVLLLVLIYFIFFATSSKDKKKDDPKPEPLVPPPVKEHYSNIGDIDNVGSLDGNTAYEMIPAAELDAPAAYFADLVNTGDQVELVKSASPDNIRPMERLERIAGSQLLPRTAAQATPYNVDIADPTTHLFSVNAPRVQIKDRLWNRADPYRGDIPIKYHPNIALVGKSSHGRDAQRLDGFWSDASRSLYNKYTGKGYLNMPLHVVNGETVMDYSP